MSLNPRLLGAFVLTGYFFAHDLVYLNRPGSCLDTIVGSAGEHTCSRSHCEIEGFEHGEFHGVYTADLTCGCPGYAWVAVTRAEQTLCSAPQAALVVPFKDDTADRIRECHHMLTT